MTMRKRNFDAIWAIAAASGATSAWLYGHPIFGFPLSSPILLGVGIVVAAYLSISVQRDTKSGDATVATEEMESEPPPSENDGNNSLAVRDYSSSVVRYQRAMQARVVKSGWAALSPPQGLLYARYEEVIESHITNGRQPNGRINLLNDAVHIAKQLRGSGFQIEITKDDKLLLREPVSHGEFPKESQQLSSKLPAQNTEWLN